MKAHEIIARSMRLIGALGSGESASAEEINDGLVALNSMLSSWSAQRLFVYKIEQDSFYFTADVARYTIGPGGDWDMARPIDIQGIFTRISNVDVPVTITKDRTTYDDLQVKTLINTSWPSLCYYEASYPVGALWFYPKPAQASQVFVDSWLELPSFTAYDDVALPPGYERAITYSLAVEFGPEFGKLPSQAVVEIAGAARLAIKLRNLPEPVMRVSLGTGGSYDITSDTHR